MTLPTSFAVSQWAGVSYLPKDQTAYNPITATGNVAFSANPADTNTITLSDGYTQVVFEMDSGGGVTGSNTAVTIGGTAAISMTNLLAAITSSGLALTWNVGSPSTTSTDFFATPIITTLPTWAKTGANITVTGLATSTGIAGETLSIYYPSGKPSDYPDVNGDEPDRWKTLLVLNLSGDGTNGTTSNGTFSTAAASAITSANGLIYQALCRGLAVVHAQLTAQQAAVGATGHGFLHLPGGVDGYYESKNRPSSIKDMVLVMQHIRFNTFSYKPSESGSYKLSGKVALFGVNSGFPLPWIGSAPSRACELGNGGPYEMNTVPNFIVADAIYPYHWLKFKNNDAQTGAFFPGAETGGAGADDVKAATIANAPQRYVKGLSAHALLSDTGVACHPKMFCFSNTGPEDLNFGEPFVENVRAFATGVHDSWHMLTLRQALPAGTMELRLSAGAANTLTSTQTASTAIKTPDYYDGDLSVASAGHVASTGSVSITGAISDGDLVTISDGYRTVVFEFDNNSSVANGNHSITLSGVAATNMNRLLIAIAAEALKLTWVAGVPSTSATNFSSSATDIPANTTWTTTGVNVSVTGLSGGTGSTNSLTSEDQLTGYAINALVRHCQDKCWDDSLPAPGIRRESQVNTTGRCIVPARRKADRAFIRLENTDASDTLFYGQTLMNCNARLEAGQRVDIYGSGKLFAKASDSVCTYRAREMPLGAT